MVGLGLGSTNAIDLAIRGPDADTLRRLGLDYTARLRSAGCRGVVLAVGWGEAVELRAPLTVAVMGGLCSATVLTLISLPSVLLLASGRGSNKPAPMLDSNP